MDRQRTLKAAPHDTDEIGAIDPVERTTRALQATILASLSGEDKE